MEKGGASGLELKYDSLLEVFPVKIVKNRKMDDVVDPAQDIMICTTLDAEIRNYEEPYVKTPAGSRSGTAIQMKKTGDEGNFESR